MVWSEPLVIGRQQGAPGEPALPAPEVEPSCSDREKILLAFQQRESHGLSVWLDLVFRFLHIPEMVTFSATRDREFRCADIFGMSAERNMFLLRAHVSLSGHFVFAFFRMKANIGRTFFAQRTFGECPLSEMHTCFAERTCRGHILRSPWRWVQNMKNYIQVEH